MRNRPQKPSGPAVLTAALVMLALVVSCSDDSNNDGKLDDATIAPTTSGFGGTTTLPLDVPTTFIQNCAMMPEPSAISAVVGIPLADGQVVAAGTCLFVGVNEQRRAITLSLLTDPADIASFNDLQLSLGPSTPLNDPVLPNAMIDPTSVVYITINNAIYSVFTQITDATVAEQVPLSAAVLRLWLGL